MSSLNRISSIIAGLRQFNYTGEYENVISSNMDAYADLSAEQMAQAKDVNGDEITLDGVPSYQPVTIVHKKRFGSGLGAITDRVTRYQSGTLYKELFAQVTSGQVILSARVDYWDKLLDRTGPQGTGLDPEMRARFSEEVIVPAFKKVFSEKTGIKTS